jgi:hypothetical protein
MSDPSPRSETGYSLGFFFGFLVGAFGTMLFTTDTGKMLLEKMLEAGEEKTRELWEEGSEAMSRVDLDRFWHDEHLASERESKPREETDDDSKLTDFKSTRRFFRRS